MGHYGFERYFVLVGVKGEGMIDWSGIDFITGLQVLLWLIFHWVTHLWLKIY
jgi:hypothetical protein